MKLTDLGFSSEYADICELMFSENRSEAFSEIEKYKHTEIYVPLLIIAAVESLWRNEEKNTALDLLKPMITPAQEDSLRHCSHFFVWWGIFSLRLAESVKADPEFPLAPFWKEIILLAFYKTGDGGGTCYNYGLLPISVILEHILEKQYYMTDLNDFFLEDLLDELASLDTDTLNLIECPFTKISFKPWTNPNVTSLYIWLGTPYRVMRVLKKAFPNWSEAAIKEEAANAIKSAEESQRKGFDDVLFYSRSALNFLRLISPQNRKSSYYKMRKKAYRLAGRGKMAEYSAVRYGI